MAEGEDKDFKKEFEIQYNEYKKKAKKEAKRGRHDIGEAYIEAAEKLKQQYEAKSPKVMKELEDWHKIRKLEEHIMNIDWAKYGKESK